MKIRRKVAKYEKELYHSIEILFYGYVTYFCFFVPKSKGCMYVCLVITLAVVDVVNKRGVNEDIVMLYWA